MAKARAAVERVAAVKAQRRMDGQARRELPQRRSERRGVGSVGRRQHPPPEGSLRAGWLAPAGCPVHGMATHLGHLASCYRGVDVALLE